jgi:hypothetical protein
VGVAVGAEVCVGTREGVFVGIKVGVWVGVRLGIREGSTAGLGEGDEVGISTTRLVAVEFIGMFSGRLLVVGIPLLVVLDELQAAPAKMVASDMKNKAPRILGFFAICVDVDTEKPMLNGNDFDHNDRNIILTTS